MPAALAQQRLEPRTVLRRGELRDVIAERLVMDDVMREMRVEQPPEEARMASPNGQYARAGIGHVFVQHRFDVGAYAVAQHEAGQELERDHRRTGYKNESPPLSATVWPVI